MPQVIKNPADYCFECTDPTPSEPMGWYRWDRAQTHKLAYVTATNSP